MSLLDDIGDYLDLAGVGVVGVTLFLGTQPDTPSECVTVLEYPGNAPEYLQDSTVPAIESPQIQVLARGMSYVAARATCQEAWDVLSTVTNEVLGTTRYLSIRPNGSPAPLGRDNNDRFLIAFNATVRKEPDVSGESGS